MTCNKSCKADTFSTDVVYVFYCSGLWRRKRHKLSWRRRLRILWRFPRRSYHYLLGWLVRTITRSPIAHVCIGHDGAVLDASIQANQFWPLYTFLLYYPTCLGYHIIPVEGDAVAREMGKVKCPGPHKKAWPTVLRWISRGAVETQDCVAMACRILRAGGVRVPRQVVSPRQLFEFCRQRRYKYVPFPE